jgi:hypothetical protein
MNRLHMPSTSHTVVLAQLYDLERALVQSGKSHGITADELGLTDAALLPDHQSETLPAAAVLERLWWEGPSEYPFVYASFRLQPDDDEEDDKDADVDELLTNLHTAALQALSHRLKLHQSWGF